MRPDADLARFGLDDAAFQRSNPHLFHAKAKKPTLVGFFVHLRTRGRRIWNCGG